jgi:hypothetical protein
VQYSTGIFSPDQQSAIAARLLAAGVDPAVVAAAAKQDGITIPDAAADPRGADEKQMDATFGWAKDGDYKLDLRGITAEDGSPLDIPAQVTLKAGLNKIAAAAMLPARFGGQVLEQTIQAGQRYSKLDLVGQALYNRQQSIELSRSLGDDGARAAISSAKIAISIMRDAAPDLMKALEARGAFRDAATINQLSWNIQRLETRLAMANKRLGVKS